MERRRLASVALMLLVMVWFSMGANASPLIRYYPFSSLDVARFHLYMVPFMALLAAMSSQRFLEMARGSKFQLLAPQVWSFLATVVVALVLVHPVYDAWQARRQAEPYRVEPEVRQALDWLATTPLDAQGNPPKV